MARETVGLAEASTPDIAGVLLGVRRWNWYHGRLCSVHVSPAVVKGKTWHPADDVVWQPYSVMQARHLVPVGSDFRVAHRAPLPHCYCGLFAFYDLALANTNYQLGGAWGIVRAWGDIEEHEYGFRAEFMQPIAILGPGTMTNAVSETYGLPTVRWEEAGAWMREAKGTFLEGGQEWHESAEG